MKTTSKPSKANKTKPAAAPAPEIRLIERNLIHRSELNPRTEFDNNYIENELAPSIKAMGILQPIVVRPSTRSRIDIANNHAEIPMFEIIMGECRYRAAEHLDLKTIPCIVREARDIDLQKMALAENIARKDISPVEEGRAYKRLLGDGATIAELEKEFGVKKSAIYGRIKLTELCKLALDSLAAGELSHSVALRIARIPGTESQVRCTKRILENPYHQTDKGVADLIATQYMTELKGAPFDRSDKTLNPERGCCDKCSFRTGNQGDLWGGEMKGRADICTDPVCYKAKCSSSQERKLDAHRKSGATILMGDDAKKIVNYGWIRDDDYLDLDKPHPDDESDDAPTLRELIGGHLNPKKITALVDNTVAAAKLFELIPVAEVEALAKANKVILPEPEAGEGDKEPRKTPEELAKEREEEDLSRAYREHLSGKLADKIERSTISTANEAQLLRELLFYRLKDSDFDAIAERRGVEICAEEKTPIWGPYLERQTIADLHAFHVEVALHEIGFSKWSAEAFCNLFDPIEKLYPLDKTILHAKFRNAWDKQKAKGGK